MTPKQKVVAWARKVWGLPGVAARRNNPHLHDDDSYLIGRLESGFLGEGIRYFGAGPSWDAALIAAKQRVDEKTGLGQHRGWTNGFKL